MLYGGRFINHPRSPASPFSHGLLSCATPVHIDVVVAGARRRFAVQDYERHESSHVRRSAAVVLGERLLVFVRGTLLTLFGLSFCIQYVTGHLACVFCLPTSRYPVQLLWRRTAYQMEAAIAHPGSFAGNVVFNSTSPKPYVVVSSFPLPNHVPLPYTALIFPTSCITSTSRSTYTW